MYLLDTHTLVWAITAPDRLTPQVQKVLATEPVKTSVVSYWELMLKKGRPNSPITHPTSWWDHYVIRPATEVLPVHVRHVERLGNLGDWHRDPFDRMLVAQAMVEGLTLVSKDALLARYGVPVFWD